LDISNHRFNLDKMGLSSSLPPTRGGEGVKLASLRMGSITGSITSISEDQDWLPKGVEFCTNMEVYVFKSEEG
jgi:hypothetical protein